MVSWLIEDYDIRVRQKKASKSDSHLLTSGEGADVSVIISSTEAETFKNSSDLTFICITVLMVITCCKAVISLENGCKLVAGFVLHFLFKSPYTALHLKNIALCFLHGIIYGGVQTV